MADAETPTAEEARALAAFKFDVFDRRCPARPTLEHVTGRWGVLVLGGLDQGALRFSELLRRVDGVSEKMLTQALQALQRDGFVHREELSTFPLRVEYTLTPLGREVAGRIRDLIGAIESNMPEVMAAHQRYDDERASARQGAGR